MIYCTNNLVQQDGARRGEGQGRHSQTRAETMKFKPPYSLSDRPGQLPDTRLQPPVYKPISTASVHAKTWTTRFASSTIHTGSCFKTQPNIKAEKRREMLHNQSGDLICAYFVWYHPKLDRSLLFRPLPVCMFLDVRIHDHS